MKPSPSIIPLPERFTEYLQDYCEQAAGAIKANKHHDQRRALFMDYLRKAFEVQVEEVDLEHKVKAASARGRIDAFYRFVIFEFKTDLERERPDALTELAKYFQSQQNPADYIAAVTDGLDFEVFDYDPKTRGPQLIRSFRLETEAPLAAYEQLDELLSAGRKIQPVSGEVVVRFGPVSIVFNRSRQMLRAAYESVKNLSSVKVKFREWNALLAKVYGTSPDDEDLFIRHTYLTMVSRAVVTLALFRERQHGTALYRGLINGDFFRDKSIRNLAEPDFFSWGLNTETEPAFFEFFANLFRRLGEFEWSKVDEDLLKVLYQELVESGDRQQLGEFYTPDWLAELTLDDIGYRRGTLLDPACGSGTFLFCAIRRLRASGLKGNQLVKTALESVTGIDVHPVAALMAKANILLALAAELPKYPEDVYLRVYLADTLMTGEDAKKRALEVKASESEVFYIPLESLEKGRDLDTLIDKLAQLAKRGAASKESQVLAEQGFAKSLSEYSSGEIFLWRENFKLMMGLVESKRDTVWAFILKNAYRPAYLRRQKVDVIVANPPWLSLRDVQDPAYKTKIKELAFRYNLLERTDRKLFTQLDTSTVFFAHCEHEFLCEGGSMAFVMPRSVILPAKQHLAFQKGGFTKINDFGEVSGLFRVPTCVIIRKPRVLTVEIPLTEWNGDLPRGRRNLSWHNAKGMLKSRKAKWSFLSPPTVRSPYFPLVVQGATLVPRSLWFVEPPGDRPLVVKIPFLRTSKAASAGAKKPWRLKFEIEGRVEKEFLFGTALSEDLLPFAIRRLRLVVLPAAAREGRFAMLERDDILAEGAVGTSDWVEKAETIWSERKKEGQPSLIEYLNYDQKITNQNPQANFIVLYNKSGTNLAAAHLTPSQYKQIGDLPIRGFVADHVTYRYYADSEEHALYLVGVLNSALVNEAIKPFQSQGLQGERDIHRRPFEVCPIPIFDPKRKLHRQIAAVAREAARKMVKWSSKIEGKAARAREAGRKVVQAELDQLDPLVAELLNGHELVAQIKQNNANAQMSLPKT
ncbi:MAG TPA: N-6 DNA methylase [Terriglobia bacterium]|nr:N-6 DNA methylase [Terriglobia bacterium]